MAWVGWFKLIKFSGQVAHFADLDVGHGIPFDHGNGIGAVHFLDREDALILQGEFFRVQVGLVNFAVAEDYFQGCVFGFFGPELGESTGHGRRVGGRACLEPGGRGAAGLDG